MAEPSPQAASSPTPSDNDAPDMVMTEEQKRLEALKPASRPSWKTTAYLYRRPPDLATQSGMPFEQERQWQIKLIGKRLLWRGTREEALKDIKYWQGQAQAELEEAQRSGSEEEVERARRLLEEQLEAERRAPFEPPEWDIDFADMPENWCVSGTVADDVDRNRLTVIFDNAEQARYGRSIITHVYAG